MSRVALALTAAALALPATASAHVGPSLIYGVDDGHPTLDVWAYDGDTVAGVSRCAADGSSCEPLPITRHHAWAGERHARARPGVTPPGTVLQAVITRGGGTVEYRTPVWEGTLSPEPPTLVGAPVVGGTV